MKLSSFTFELPNHLLPKYPPDFRENARLMVARRDTQEITHHKFSEITKFFQPEDVIVLNDTKVAPIYFEGYKEKTGAIISMLLLRELDEEYYLWDTVINPARKIRVGNKLYFGEHELVAEVVDNTTSRGRTIRFLFEAGAREKLHQLLDQLGVPPIFPILKREAEDIDRARYQTVFAEEKGSVVPPLAGLHFTEYILKSMKLRGVHTPAITAHISHKSLSVLDAEDLNKYKLGSTKFKISQESAEIVNKALVSQRKVCAVDVSTLQALETSTSSIHQLKAQEGWTNKFVRPVYTPKIANALLTNFYLPKSIPFVNTVGFGGYEFIKKKVYPTALAEGYNFFVYGDALLIL